MVSVNVDVDLDDFSDDEIRREYEDRNLGGLIDNIEAEECRRLAELIAAGEKDEALELLHRLSRQSFSLAVVRRLAPVRQPG